MLTDIHRDGTNKGLNTKAAKIISDSSIPIIFSGAVQLLMTLLNVLKKLKYQQLLLGLFALKIKIHCKLDHKF